PGAASGGGVGILELDGLPDHQRPHPHAVRLRGRHADRHGDDRAEPARHGSARDPPLPPRRDQPGLRDGLGQGGGVRQRHHHVQRGRLSAAPAITAMDSSRRGRSHRLGRLAWGVALAALLIGAAAPASAQSRGKIAGRVTDAATGESLPGVNVVIAGTALGTSTDANGDYFIANLEVGTYDVRASFIGYDALTVTGVDVNPNATATVDFALRETTL